MKSAQGLIKPKQVRTNLRSSISCYNPRKLVKPIRYSITLVVTCQSNKHSHWHRQHHKNGTAAGRHNIMIPLLGVAKSWVGQQSGSCGVETVTKTFRDKAERKQRMKPPYCSLVWFKPSFVSLVLPMGLALGAVKTRFHYPMNIQEAFKKSIEMFIIMDPN